MSSGSLFAGALVGVAGAMLAALATYAVPPSELRSHFRTIVPASIGVAGIQASQRFIARRGQFSATLNNDLTPANAGRIRTSPQPALE